MNFSKGKVVVENNLILSPAVREKRPNTKFFLKKLNKSRLDALVLVHLGSKLVHSAQKAITLIGLVVGCGK